MAEYTAEVRVSTDYTITFEAPDEDTAYDIAERAAQCIQFESGSPVTVTTDGVEVDVSYDGPYDTEVTSEPWTDEEDED